MQIDLFSKANTNCVLAQLGSASLPVGSYQQIRLLLVSNSPAAGAPVPSPNACAGNGFNCALLDDGTIHELLLSSQDNTGLKIPPGRIVGGPIQVAAGQSVDLNIDFNACASIVRQGNGKYRLKPTLSAQQVADPAEGLGLDDPVGVLVEGHHAELVPGGHRGGGPQDRLLADVDLADPGDPRAGAAGDAVVERVAVAGVHRARLVDDDDERDVRLLLPIAHAHVDRQALLERRLRETPERSGDLRRVKKTLIGLERRRRNETRAAFREEWPKLKRRGRKAWR